MSNAKDNHKRENASALLGERDRKKRTLHKNQLKVTNALEAQMKGKPSKCAFPTSVAMALLKIRPHWIFYEGKPQDVITRSGRGQGKGKLRKQDSFDVSFWRPVNLITSIFWPQKRKTWVGSSIWKYGPASRCYEWKVRKLLSPQSINIFSSFYDESEICGWYL